MEAYLDNAATTRALDEVAHIMDRVLTEDYGNPSSLHQKGVDAEQYIRRTREIIAGKLKCKPGEIFFTSGGTESNNTALYGAALANRRMGNHLITSSIEHASVLNPMAFLEKQGYEVTYLPVDHRGILDLDALKKSLDEHTTVVSLMGVNNEVGAVEPIEEAAKIIREFNDSEEVKKRHQKVILHVDAIQMFGKLPIYPGRMGIDMLSVSGHKIHGPKGSGFLYVKEGTRVHPLILGGNQQEGFRSGTENVPAIAGLGVAVEQIFTDHDEKFDRMRSIKADFIRKVTSLPDVTDNSGDAPHVASLTFRGVRSEVMLHALEARGVYCSSGSACSSNKPGLSGTLRNMGLSDADAESTLRFSFSVFTTKEELDYTAQCISEELPKLRRYTRK